MLLLAHTLIASVLAVASPPVPAAIQSPLADTGTPAPGVVLTKLQGIADARFPDPKFRLMVTVEDGAIYRWHMQCVDLDRDLSDRVMESGRETTTDRWIMLREWADELNHELVDLTAETVREAGLDPEFNAETDVQFRVIGSVASIGSRTGNATSDRPIFHAAYVGSMRTWLTQRPELANDQTPAPKGGSLRIDIVPDREGWHVGEPITGRIVLTNTGDSRVPVPIRWSEMIRAFGADGAEPETFAFSGCILYSNTGPRNDFVSAGASREASFRLLTTPKDDFDSGQYLTPGIWMLELSGTLCENVEQVATPASVLVVPNS